MTDQPAIDALGLNPKQAATIQLLVKVATWMRMSALLTFLGADILLAKERLHGGLWLSSALEDNQWQKEMENIHNASMAFLQQRITDHASLSNSWIYESVKLNENIVRESTPEALQLCANQKIWSTTHYSFSMVGMLLIMLGGTFVILVNVSLPHFVGWLQRRSGKGLTARLDWIESEPLQLQRVAFECRGIGPWKGSENDVPVTTDFGQKFRRTRLYPGNNAAIQLSELSNPLIKPGSFDRKQSSHV
jgi:hypothetical protein